MARISLTNSTAASENRRLGAGSTYTLQAALLDGTAAKNLTGLTVTCEFVALNLYAEVFVGEAATVTNAAAGEVEFALLSAHLTKSADDAFFSPYGFRFVVDDGESDLEYFPGKGYIPIIVHGTSPDVTLAFFTNQVDLVLDQLQAATDAADDLTAINALLYTGTGSPEGVTTAAIGALFLRTDGGASTTLYVKESGAGNTGWVAK